ncbi:MAG: hypothetical protein IJW63_06255 [Lachnospiraceae bacterium]|nr:hypothetical protein [Lachnospiraceae bacterium]
MNRNTLPLILMLVTGGITCIITYAMDYSITQKLVYLLIVLILFYFLGNVIKWTLNRFDRENEKLREEEGEVIEKDNPPTEEQSEDTFKEE